MSNKILVNNIFVGRYSLEGNNLPGEFINFFQDDDGHFYVFIAPYGVIDKRYKDEIKGIIWVRTVETGVVEVLAKAKVTDIKKYYGERIKINNKKDKIEEINEHIPDDVKDNFDKIKYGGKSLNDIHKEDPGVKLYASFPVDKLYRPNRKVFLTYLPNKNDSYNDSTIYVLAGEDENKKGKKINNQSMKVYYDSENDKACYNTLNNLIIEEELWNDVKKYDDKDIKGRDNFLKMSMNQDSETTFTNILFYYLSKYRDLVKPFVEEFLGIDEIGEKQIEKLEVEREKDYMDLRLKSDDWFIIIENKIHSGINGMEYINSKDHSEGYRKDNKTGGYISQLSKYYEKALEEMGCDNKIKCYILKPDYANLNTKDYYYYEKYKDKKYSELKEFFETHKNKLNGDKYIEDFINALDRHSTETDTEFINEILIRLRDRINSLNNSSSTHTD